MYFGQMGLFGSIVIILFWLLFIGLIVWLVRQNREEVKESSVEVLKKRYVEGEITKEQYKVMKKDILE